MSGPTEEDRPGAGLAPFAIVFVWGVIIACAAFWAFVVSLL